MTSRFMLTLTLFGVMASASVTFAEFQRASSHSAATVDTAVVSEIIKRSSVVPDIRNLPSIEHNAESNDFDMSLNPPIFDEWIVQEGESIGEGDRERPGSEFLKRLIDTTQ